MQKMLTKTGKLAGFLFVVLLSGMMFFNSAKAVAEPILANISISPNNIAVVVSGTLQFTVSALDQFGNSFSAPAVSWSIDAAAGTIDNNGLWTAAGVAGGPFTVTADDGNGHIATTSVGIKEEQGGIGGAVPPAAPTNVTAVADSQTQITLSWSGEAPVYKVDYSGVDVTFGTTTEKTFVIGDRECGVTYTFIIFAINDNGVTSSPSASVSVTTTACSVVSGGGGGGGGSAPIVTPPVVSFNKDATSPSAAVVPGSNSVVLAKFYAKPSPEDMELRKIVLAIINGGGHPLAGMLYVKVNGDAVYSVAATDISTDAANPTNITLVNYPTMPMGQNAYITVEANISLLANNVDSYRVYLDLAEVKRLVSNDIVEPVATPAYGNSIGVMAAALTVTNLASPVSQSVVVSTNNFTFARIELNAGVSGEDVKVNSITITDTLGGDAVYSNIQNLTLYGPDGNPLVTAVSNTTSTTFGFASPILVTRNTPVVLTLKADVASGNSGTHQFAATSVTASGKDTGVNVVDLQLSGTGQAMTIAASGALSLSLVSGTNASPAINQLVTVGTQNLSVFAFKLTALNEAQKITTLKLTASGTAISSNDVLNLKLYRNSETTPFATGSQMTCASAIACTFTWTATDNLLPEAIQPGSSVTIYVKADVGGQGQAKLGEDFKFKIASSTTDVVAKGAYSGQAPTLVGAPYASGITYIAPFNVTVSGEMPVAGSANTQTVINGTQLAVFKVTNNGTGKITLRNAKFYGAGSHNASASTYDLHASSENTMDTSVSLGTGLMSKTGRVLDFGDISEAGVTIEGGGNYRYLTVALKQAIIVEGSTWKFSVEALGDLRYDVDENNLGYDGNQDGDYLDVIAGLRVDGKPTLGVIVALNMYNNPPIGDVTAPVIALNGGDEIILHVGDTYVEQGATATDNFDGEIGATISGEVYTTQVWDQYVWYRATDAAGNLAEKMRTIHVVRVPPAVPDVTLPELSLRGNSTVIMAVGDTYIEAGADAWDDTDEDITDKIIITNLVNTSTPGNYVVSYTVSDVAGNTATLSRAVKVYKALSSGPLVPTVFANADGAGSAVWTNLENAGVSDDQYAAATSPSLTKFSNSKYLTATGFGFNIPTNEIITGIKVEVERKGISEPTSPALPSNYTPRDISATLVKGGVIDTENNNRQAEKNYWYTVDTVKIYGGSSDTWGQTLAPADVNSPDFGFAINVNMGVGAVSVDSVKMTVYYTDTVAPVITLIGDATVNLKAGDVYNELGATVTDNSGEVLAVIVGGDQVNTAVVGNYQVTYDAKDSSNNSAVQIVRKVVVSKSNGGDNNGNGGGGGGGGGGIIYPPFNPPEGGFKVVINNGASETESAQVILTLAGGDSAVRMTIANNHGFVNSVQEAYSATKNWQLDGTQGMNKVYVKFYDGNGTESPVVSDEIKLTSKLAVLPSSLENQQVLGEKISLLDELIGQTKFGQRSDLVKQLQNELKAAGFFPAKQISTGYYGPITRGAVQKYLETKNQRVLGVKISSLDELIGKTKFGMRGSLVKQLQTELTKAGYMPKGDYITGYYGIITQGAIRKYLASIK